MPRVIQHTNFFKFKLSYKNAGNSFPQFLLSRNSKNYQKLALKTFWRQNLECVLEGGECIGVGTYITHQTMPATPSKSPAKVATTSEKGKGKKGKSKKQAQEGDEETQFTTLYGTKQCDSAKYDLVMLI